MEQMKKQYSYTHISQKYLTQLAIETEKWKMWNYSNSERTNLTNAFCLGETRQQMTDAQSTANPRNRCFISSSKA